MARFVGMHASYAFGVMLCLLTACAQPEPAAQELEPDSLLALVQRVDAGPMREAFAALDHVGHVQYHRTEQFRGDGARTAYRETVVRRAASGSVELRSDAAGAFDFGYLSRFVDRTDSTGSPADLPGEILPDDPPYASARNREAFSYALRRNVQLNGRAVRVVEIAALPETGDAQSIRRAVLYLDPTDDILVAYRIERADAALWFREESLLFMSLERADSEWVPKQVRLETALKLPFRPEQRFRNVMSFYGYENR